MRRDRRFKEDLEQLHLWIPRSVVRRFRELIAVKYKTYEKGLLSWEATQALQNWIELHMGEHTRAQISRPNPPANVYKVYLQVRDWMELECGREFERGNQVGAPFLEKAIAAVRGGDKRTIRKWMKLFHQFGLIKPLTAGVWELL